MTRLAYNCYFDKLHVMTTFSYPQAVAWSKKDKRNSFKTVYPTLDTTTKAAREFGIHRKEYKA